MVGAAKKRKSSSHEHISSPASVCGAEGKSVVGGGGSKKGGSLYDMLESILGN